MIVAEALSIVVTGIGVTDFHWDGRHRVKVVTRDYCRTGTRTRSCDSDSYGVLEVITDFQRTRVCLEFAFAVETVEAEVRFLQSQRPVAERDVLAENSWSGPFAARARQLPIHAEQTC
jgi:hypothetical protein